ncbi:hypothetical protein FC83_GL001129 [Agrilactobacillus composti DSM 18527 = JCM 14202]|uniref:OsmC family protein n=1 Tax=Agrilactobacillus composti DSM 18527 = JCM 14202 TaxID=1423734 RepID=X0PQX1_9LACO|nr:OsmC family protein [Agrilactobacillus composti]KRM31126.1 hypothetical protein FC83_GL001129 [Agrilactobacillus composti DSM 18527 = JCM 14202]GAF39481.1 hypothetical protein JCM14202_1346 [Agrilactobacillus composti DSM 18527 = JCM 14202]
MEKHLTVNLNDAGMVMTNKGQTVHIGHGSGEVSPVKLLQTAAAACTLGTYRIILENSKIPYSDLSIESTMIQADTAPNQVKALKMVLTVRGAKATDEKLALILKMTHRSCTVVQSIQGTIDVDTQLVIAQA